MTIPTMIIIDHQQGRVTADGHDIAEGFMIAADPEIEMLDGVLARVDLGLYAENVLVISRRGHVSSPTAAHEARQIVRKGLAHILEWLGEDV